MRIHITMIRVVKRRLITPMSWHGTMSCHLEWSGGLASPPCGGVLLEYEKRKGQSFDDKLIVENSIVAGEYSIIYSRTSSALPSSRTDTN